MTLEDFKIHILADGQKKYTEQQIQTMFEIASQFSNFAFKKWGEEMQTIVSRSVTIDL